MIPSFCASASIAGLKTDSLESFNTYIGLLEPSSMFNSAFP